MAPAYTPRQLQVLYYLKDHGPLKRKRIATRNNPSLITVLSDALGMSDNSVRAILKELEDRCAVLRTWDKGRPETFAQARGTNLIRIELVDPEMKLPARPVIKPVPAIVIDARENEDLYQRSACEPSSEAVIVALLSRNDELQEQVNRLQDIVQQLTRQQAEARRVVPDHLTSRIRDALTPEQWDEVTHGTKR